MRLSKGLPTKYYKKFIYSGPKIFAKNICCISNFSLEQATTAKKKLLALKT